MDIKIVSRETAKKLELAALAELLKQRNREDVTAQLARTSLETIWDCKAEPEPNVLLVLGQVSAYGDKITRLEPGVAFKFKYNRDNTPEITDAARLLNTVLATTSVGPISLINAAVMANTNMKSKRDDLLRRLGWVYANLDGNSIYAPAYEHIFNNLMHNIQAAGVVDTDQITDAQVMQWWDLVRQASKINFMDRDPKQHDKVKEVHAKLFVELQIARTV